MKTRMSSFLQWPPALLLTTLMFLCSCGEKKAPPAVVTDEPEEEPLPERYENDDLPKAADELFDDFAYYFASNERLQHRRTTLPLGVTHIDGRQQQVSDSMWQMEPLFTEMGEYVRIFDNADQLSLPGDTSVESVVVEKIFLTADSVKMYHFMRTDGCWQLTHIDHQHLAKNANAAFLRFYSSFATDSAFRQRCLAREIAFSGPDPDDDFARMEGFITPNSWDAFAPELPRDSIYNIVYGPQNGNSKEKHFVICGIANGMETDLTFERKRGQWRLTRLNE